MIEGEKMCAIQNSQGLLFAGYKDGVEHWTTDRQACILYPESKITPLITHALGHQYVPVAIMEKARV